eukprot:g8853.t1
MIDRLRSSITYSSKLRLRRPHEGDITKPVASSDSRREVVSVQASSYVNRRPLRSRSNRIRQRSPSPIPLRQNEPPVWKRVNSPNPNIPNSNDPSKRAPFSVEIERGLEALVTKHRVRRTQKRQMRMFMELGLSIDEISKLLRKRIAVVDHKPATIKRKFQFLVENTSMTRNQLKRLFLKFPRILEYNMKKTVQPRLDYLKSLGCQKPDLAKILLQAPAVAELSVENTLKPRVDFLRDEVGIHPESLTKTLLKQPQLLTLSQESVSTRVAFLQEWGLTKNDIARMVMSHPQVLHYSVQGMMEHVSYLLHIGVSRTGVQRILTRFPQILGLDLEVNVMPKLKYLRGELGGTPLTLENNPVFVGLSLKKRIIPRHQFLSKISTTEVPHPVPINWFKCSDEVFANTVAKVPLEEFIAYKNTCHAN